MPYIIDEVSIEGFRGINKNFRLKMHEGVCLLYGRNGTGKTSVLQAIEWCLTGKLPYLEGREFRYEDAIVNMFHPKKTAVVSIVLKDGNGKALTVTRRRKMAKSTTRGKSYLQVETDEELLKDDEGQQKLEQILGITTEDFPKIVYLHQEAIRDIVTADPKEMSQTIDRLLGTFELRELAEALDMGRIIKRETKNLRARAETLERDKIVFVVRMRERLNHEKETLLEKGYTENQLTVENVANMVNSIIEDIKGIATKLGSPAPIVEAPELSSQSIADTMDETEKELKALDRFRTTAYSQQEKIRLNLEDLRRQHEEAEKNLQEFGAVTPESLLEKKKEIEDQLEQSRPELKNLQNSVNRLVEAKIKLESASQQIDVLKKQIAEIERSLGDEKQHLDSIQRLKSNLAELEDEIRKFSAHAQIVSLALEFLEKSKPEECPVCSQPIDYQSVVSKLKKDTQILVSENITRLREKEKEVRKNLRDIEKSLGKYKDISTRLASEEAKLETVRQEVESIIGKKIDPSFDIDQAIEESRQESSDLTARSATLTNKSLELDQKYNALRTCIDKLREVQSSMQKAIKSSKVGKKLIQDLQDEIERVRDKIKSYEDTKAIDEAEARIEAIKEFVEYLQNKEELERLEKELPQVTELVSDLKAGIEKLAVLEGSLEAIRQVAMAHQREVVITTLGALEDSINHFYNGILGHPFFVKLRLEPEEEHPFIYSIKGLSSDLTRSTYIPTRFSNTQMNIVALSLFLSNNTRIASNLALVIMDDPAQSMDGEHKKALAKTIHGLSMNRQIIIATQDVELKTATDEICKDKLHTYEFTGWSIDHSNVVSN